MTGIVYSDTGRSVEAIVAVNSNPEHTRWRAQREGYGMLTDADVADVPDDLRPGEYAIDFGTDPPSIVPADRNQSRRTRDDILADLRDGTLTTREALEELLAL